MEHNTICSTWWYGSVVNKIISIWDGVIWWFFLYLYGLLFGPNWGCIYNSSRTCKILLLRLWFNATNIHSSMYDTSSEISQGVSQEVVFDKLSNSGSGDQGIQHWQCSLQRISVYVRYG